MNPLPAIRAALSHGDIDAALELGLMEVASLHTEGAPADTDILVAATQLRIAWEARERYRARAARLARRAEERRRRHEASSSTPTTTPNTDAAPTVNALPGAAAAALARALAKAQR